MPVITQTANAKAIWNGTVSVADAAVTAINLYASSGAETRGNYRLAKVVTVGAPGTITLGPVSYPALFLGVPTRTFYLKAVEVVSGKEKRDASAETALSVTPSTVVGWSMAQLLEQDGRPVFFVAQDPTSGLFYPLKAVVDAAGDYVLKVNTSA